jgi:hypothetical protein
MDICDLCNYDFGILENNILEKNETFLIDLFRVLKTNHNNIDLIEYLNNFSLNITNKVSILNILLDIIKRLNKNDKFNLIKLIYDMFFIFCSLRNNKNSLPKIYLSLNFKIVFFI